MENYHKMAIDKPNINEHYSYSNEILYTLLFWENVSKFNPNNS